jgi:hypothetical protein
VPCGSHKWSAFSLLVDLVECQEITDKALGKPGERGSFPLVVLTLPSSSSRTCCQMWEPCALPMRS